MVPYTNSWPARQVDLPALHATTAAALANAKLYKAISWMADGGLDVVDSAGTKKTLTFPAGTTLPLQNYGVVTGGGTTLTQNQFAVLFD